MTNRVVEKPEIVKEMWRRAGEGDAQISLEQPELIVVNEHINLLHFQLAAARREHALAAEARETNATIAHNAGLRARAAIERAASAEVILVLMLENLPAGAGHDTLREKAADHLRLYGLVP
jgi:hypothetical protein